MDAPFATKFVIVSDPEALEPERTNSMVKGPIASWFMVIPPKSARVNDIEPDAPDIVFSTEFAAPENVIVHLRTPARSET